MPAYVFGDSHGHYLFARAQGATLHCLPGHTMHRAGRDGVRLFLDLIEPSQDDVFVFGEIDVRQHLVRVAGEKAWSYEGITADPARRYIAALSASLGHLASRLRVGVLGSSRPSITRTAPGCWRRTAPCATGSWSGIC